MASFFDNIYNAVCNSPLKRLRFNNENDVLVQIDTIDFSEHDGYRQVMFTIYTYKDPEDEEQLSSDNVYIVTVTINEKLEGLIENEAEIEAYKFILGSNLDSDFEDLTNPEFPMAMKCEYSMENGMSIIVNFFDVVMRLSKDAVQIKCGDKELPLPEF